MDQMDQMDQNQYFTYELSIMFIGLLLPGNIEIGLRSSQHYSNMALHGVYLDLYKKRNLYYFSTCLFAAICLFNKNCFLFGLLFWIFCSIVLIESCIRWKNFLFNAY